MGWCYCAHSSICARARVCVCVCFKGTTRELCVGGAAKEVTVANRAEFVQLVRVSSCSIEPYLYNNFGTESATATHSGLACHNKSPPPPPPTNTNRLSMHVSRRLIYSVPRSVVACSLALSPRHCLGVSHPSAAPPSHVAAADRFVLIDLG